MKKLLLVLAAVLLAVIPAVASDFGGSLDVTGGAAINDTTTISPTAKVTGWVKIPFDKGSFSAEAFYKFSSSIKDEGTDMTNTADLSLLKISLPLNDFISLNIGRYFFSDVTTSVFAMTSDGINATMSSGLLKFSAYAGYTGLLNAASSSLDADWTTSGDAIYELGSKYMIMLANVSAPNVLGGNTFSFEGTGALNMNGEAKAGVSDGFSRFYGTVSATGPITTTVYYSTSVTGSYFTLEEENIGIFAKGSIVCYLPYKSLTITGKGAYATDFFRGITFNPNSNGVLSAGLSATMKPVSNLLCLLSGDVYCDTIEKFEASSLSLQGLAKWQALSDVSAFLSLGQEIPLNSDDKGTFTVSVGGTVSF